MTEMNQLLNEVRAQADMAGIDSARPRRGIVTSYDPAHYAVKVQIEPDGHETGWLPVSTPWSGNGWGLMAPPSVGDQVDVAYQENGLEAGAVGGRYFSDVDRPTIDDGAGHQVGCPGGELWLVHATGSIIRLGNDGSITIKAHTAINSSAPAWSHTGPVNISGTLTASVDVVANGVSLYSHVHIDTQPGDGLSGIPLGGGSGGGGGGGGGSGGGSGITTGDGAILGSYWSGLG